MFKKLARQSSIYLIGDLIRRSISLFLLPFYTRYLTPSDYGLLELLDLVIIVSALLFGMSAFGESMVRVYYERDNDQDRAKVVSTVIWIVVGTGCATALIGIWAAGPLSKFVFHGADTSLVRLAFFTMLFSTLCELLMLYQQLKQRARTFATFTVIQTFCSIILNIFFIAGLHMGVWGFVLSKCIVVSLATSVLLFMTVREVSWRFHWSTAHEVVRFGLPLIAASLAMFSIHFSDRFFINRYATLADLGIYSMAYKVGMLVSVLVGGPFNAVWNVTCYSELRNPSWREQFARALTYLTFLSASVVVALSLFARPVLHIALSSGYFGAIALIPIIALAYGLRSIGDFFPNVLFVKKRSGRVTGLCGTCALVNVALNATLIPRFGVYGAAWATLGSWLLYLMAGWSLAQKTNRLPLQARHYITITAATVSVLVANSAVHFSSPVFYWIFAIASMVIYLGVISFFGGLPIAERELLLEYGSPLRNALASAFRFSTVRMR